MKKAWRCQAFFVYNEVDGGNKEWFDLYMKVQDSIHILHEHIGYGQ